MRGQSQGAGLVSSLIAADPGQRSTPREAPTPMAPEEAAAPARNAIGSLSEAAAMDEGQIPMVAVPQEPAPTAEPAPTLLDATGAADVEKHFAQIVRLGGVLGVARTEGASVELLYGRLTAACLTGIRTLSEAVEQVAPLENWLIAEFDTGHVFARRVSTAIVWVVAEATANASMVRVALDLAAFKASGATGPRRSGPRAASEALVDRTTAELIQAFASASGSVSLARRLVEREHDRLGAQSAWPELVGQLSRLLRTDAARCVFKLECDAIAMRQSWRRLRDELGLARETVATYRDILVACARILGSTQVEDRAELDEALQRAIARVQQQSGIGAAAAEVLELASSSVAVYGEAHQCRAIQSALLPVEPVIRSPGLAVASAFLPAGLLSGDWWFHRDLSPSQSLLAVADATGHGIAAAMSTGLIRVAFEAALQAGAAETPADVLRHVSDLVHRAGQGQVVMTAIVLVLDRRSGRARVSAAGHPCPYWLRRDRSHRPSLRQVVVTGPLLGAAERSFVTRDVQLEPWDRLVLYTDGVPEALNSSGIQYGEKRLRRLLAASADREVVTQVADLMTDVALHRAHCPPSDDATLVLAEFCPQLREAP